MPRLLLLLPQLPQDAASGAARSMRLAGEMLASEGWSVRGLAVTASESATSLEAVAYLKGLGFTVKTRSPNRKLYRRDRPVHEFTTNFGIVHQLLDIGSHSVSGWQGDHGAQFNRLFQKELADHRPDVVLAFGGHPGDVERYHRAQACGCKVVFGLRNLGYLDARWLSGLDAMLTCSDFLSGAYRRALGLQSTALPSPFDLSETVADNREPIFFTAINPSIEKGLFFLARLAEELGVRRPDIPMLFIESRGSGGHLVQAGLAGGFDLRRHESLMFATAVAMPAEIFRGTRVLLVPSVCEEAFGRVAAEALLNGVPPIVSDRGGLPEAANGGGFVLPLPPSLTLESRIPVDADAVAPWLELILRLADDPSFYASSSEAASTAGKAYLPAALAPRYLEFFNGVLSASSHRSHFT